jgi:hypothetical protein
MIIEKYKYLVEALDQAANLALAIFSAVLALLKIIEHFQKNRNYRFLKKNSLMQTNLLVDGN